MRYNNWKFHKIFNFLNKIVYILFKILIIRNYFLKTRANVNSFNISRQEKNKAKVTPGDHLLPRYERINHLISCLFWVHDSKYSSTLKSQFHHIDVFEGRKNPKLNLFNSKHLSIIICAIWWELVKYLCSN